MHISNYNYILKVTLKLYDASTFQRGRVYVLDSEDESDITVIINLQKPFCTN